MPKGIKDKCSVSARAYLCVCVFLFSYPCEEARLSLLLLLDRR